MDNYLISVVLLGSSLDFYMGTKVCNNRLKRQKTGCEWRKST